MVQGPGVDSQAGSIRESQVDAGDRPGAGLGRGIEIGGPDATSAGVYGENRASCNTGDEVVELVEGLSRIGLGAASNDGSVIRRDDDVVQRPDVDGQAGSIGESGVGAGDDPDAGLG